MYSLCNIAQKFIGHKRVRYFYPCALALRWRRSSDFSLQASTRIWRVVGMSTGIEWGLILCCKVGTAK